MIDKLEIGKTYRLIDKSRYLSRRCGSNKYLYDLYFKDDMTSVNDWCTFPAISPYDFDLFELVEDNIDLYNIDKPFGELDTETKKALLCAWVDGAEIEACSAGDYYSITNPVWAYGCVYRVKPNKSTKDIAIENAQRMIQEAQLELDKAKNL